MAINHSLSEPQEWPVAQCGAAVAGHFFFMLPDIKLLVTQTLTNTSFITNNLICFSKQFYNSFP